MLVTNSVRVLGRQRAPLVGALINSYYLSTVAESVLVDQVQHSPVTHFSEDEEMTRDAARQWAQNDLKPIVRAMDDEGKIRPDVIQSLFDYGFMGMVGDYMCMHAFWCMDSFL